MACMGYAVWRAIVTAVLSSRLFLVRLSFSIISFLIYTRECVCIDLHGAFCAGLSGRNKHIKAYASIVSCSI